MCLIPDFIIYFPSIQLSYDVDDKKLREVFRLAGRVCMVQLNKDKEGKSRGHGIIEYSHPVESVQAISMFNDHRLFDRKLIVRFDQVMGPSPDDVDVLPSRLPEGLESVGMGLGQNGNPLTNVAHNLPSSNSQQSGSGNELGMVANLATTMGSLNEMATLARTMQMQQGNMMGGGGGNLNAATVGGGGGGGNMAAGNMGGGGGAMGAGMGAMGGGMQHPLKFLHQHAISFCICYNMLSFILLF